VLAQIAGTDSTEAFYNLHRHEVLQKYSSLCLGELEGEKSEVIDPQPGDLSEVPYAEPLWLKPESASPYYNDSHRRLQKAMRKFVDVHVTPEAREKEDDGTLGMFFPCVREFVFLFLLWNVLLTFCSMFHTLFLPCKVAADL
jgi:hypothetical protein